MHYPLFKHLLQLSAEIKQLRHTCEIIDILLMKYESFMHATQKEELEQVMQFNKVSLHCLQRLSIITNELFKHEIH
jgi:hypothetical protein